MDLAKELVRTVARAFYETQHVVIIDALVNHNAISLADMGVILDIGTSSHKTAQKLCGKLREGALVAVFVRAELKEGAMKPTNKEYYWIDYRRAIDAIKYRVHMLDEKIKADSKPTSEKNEYKCPRCAAEYTMMEILDLRDPMSPSGFSCKRCRTPLSALPRDGETVENADDTPAKFNKQFGKILALLQKIDNTTIPANSGEEALANALPVPRDKTNPGAKSSTVVTTGVKAATVKGVAAGPEKIDISLTDGKGMTAAEAREIAMDKQKKQAQNALPAWYTKSTVTGESITGQPNTSSDVGNGVGGLVPEDDKEEKDDTGGDAMLDDYFELLKREQESKALEPSDDEEDEEDEFVDVTGAAPKRPRLEENGSTASSKVAPTPKIVKPASVGSGSDEESEDEFEDVVGS